MRENDWLISFALLGLLVMTACAGPAYAGPNPDQVSTKSTDPDWGRSVQLAIRSTWDFGGAVGEIVAQFGRAAHHCLGFLTCLVLPLAWLGAWTLTNLPRILGLMTMRDNLRSFFRD